MLPNPVIEPTVVTGAPDPSIPAVSCPPPHEATSSAMPTRVAWKARFIRDSASVLHVVEARAEPHDPVRVVRRAGAGPMRREPGVDAFQECFALLPPKSLEVRQRAR